MTNFATKFNNIDKEIEIYGKAVYTKFQGSIRTEGNLTSVVWL